MGDKFFHISILSFQTWRKFDTLSITHERILRHHALHAKSKNAESVKLE